MMEDFRFPHRADIWYSKQRQVSSGAMEVQWYLGREGELCELHTDKFNSDTRYAITVKNGFQQFPVLIFGRFKNDVRLDFNGEYHPIDDMLITNVRDDCTGRKIFLETAEVFDTNVADIDDMDMLFEIVSFSPFTNPWGQIEYYRTQAQRMADQDLDNGDSEDIPEIEMPVGVTVEQDDPDVEAVETPVADPADEKGNPMIEDGVYW